MYSEEIIFFKHLSINLFLISSENVDENIKLRKNIKIRK